uniref:Uncharacterized protein n=1 Tax=Siphoviridae sp. ctrpg19 TaxID=2826481 RepID=A0A8S5MJY7_9CAUD|nr:MAG TPA: hypothetical protein [Siphoviridae sp. ctrpg19]
MNKCLFGGCSRKDLINCREKVQNYSCCKECPEKDCSVRCKDLDGKNKTCKWLLPEVNNINALLLVKEKPVKKKEDSAEEILKKREQAIKEQKKVTKKVVNKPLINKPTTKKKTEKHPVVKKSTQKKKVLLKSTEANKTSLW